MQAKEGALRKDKLFSKLITWKHRTECGFHWSYPTGSETLRQRARLHMAELPVPSPLLGSSSGWRDGAGLAVGSLWPSRLCSL